MTYDDLKKMGAVLGSGAVVVISDERSLYDITVSILHFFKHESCGKCVPCRIGTQLLTDMILEAKNEGDRRDVLAKMVDEARFMAQTSLCPLGQSPILPLESLSRFFWHSF